MPDKLYTNNQKISLNSSQNVCQYIDCETGRLLTMIGEFHDETFKCGKDSINISQYCKERLEKNSKCKVMLEYHMLASRPGCIFLHTHTHTHLGYSMKRTPEYLE